MSIDEPEGGAVKGLMVVVITYLLLSSLLWFAKWMEHGMENRSHVEGRNG